MRRVVVTGLGIVSSIGNNAAEVTESLKAGRSGIEFVPEYKERGFRSHVAGTLKIDVEKLVDRRLRRFMGDGAAFAWLAMKEAIADAGLDESTIRSERTALIAGSGGPSTKAIVDAADIAREKGPKRIGPFVVPKAMSSTVSANLGTAFGVRGPSYSISSACSTSAHCIGNAYETILLGKADVAFAGGGEELDWRLSVLFDAMPAMSSGFNEQRTRASRPYDKDRDGFVIAGGGIVVLEDYERAPHAARRCTARSSATAPPPTAPTWWRLRAKARCAACAWRWADRATTGRSTTSTPTAPARRWATSELDAIRGCFRIACRR